MSVVSWLLWLVEWSGSFLTAALIAGAIACWFLVASVQMPFLRSTGHHLAGALLMLAGWTALMHHAYSDGISAERAKWEAERSHEETRRDAALAAAHAQTIADAHDLLEQRETARKLQNENDRLSRLYDEKECLAPDAVDRVFRSGR
ncbi:MAG: hypothetical protein JWL62_3473 [Hyphomicrobiales bacterium]|nr:hypothetical protein [Hyphomicrobiales bacterium]